MNDIRDAKGRFVKGHKCLVPHKDGRFIRHNSVEHLGMILEDNIKEMESIQVRDEYDKGYVRGRKGAFDFVFKLIEGMGT